MAFTQTDLDRINRAIASGRLTVRDSDGRLVTYRSMSELRQARDEIQRDLEGSSGSFRARRTVGIMKRTPGPLEEC